MYFNIPSKDKYYTMNEVKSQEVTRACSILFWSCLFSNLLFSDFCYSFVEICRRSSVKDKSLS